jgi:hypothetical protein
MAAIADADVSVDVNGNIRWTGAATTNRHTVLEFIQFLMDKQDDGQVTDADTLLDITVDTAYNRSTDQILTLNAPFNIDDTFASHLYDGSVSQTDQGGETLYSGLSVIGPVEAGTEYMILQDGKVLPAFWGTGINPEPAPSLVFSRHLVKSKFAGAQIDGQRITVLARTLGDQYRRFPATLGTGNAVAAIANGTDIFNTTADATIAGWTSITNTEGQRLLDIDNDGTNEEYYSEWNIGIQTINDTYERTKWITQNAHVADATSGAVSGTDYVVDNATILGQAQSFIPLAGGELLTEARWQLKVGGGTPAGTVYCELWDSNDASPPIPTGGALARSESIPVSAITSAYSEHIFRFNLINPATGAYQNTTLDLGNVEYFIVIRNDEGTASNFVHVEGSATSVDATQDRAEDTGVWTGSATTDLNLIVKSSPLIHTVPGEQFQGINIEALYDGEAGTGLAENTIVMWGTKITYDALVNGPFIVGEYIQINVQATNAVRAGGKILYDDGVDEIVVALDTLSAVVDNDTFTTVRGAAETTATVNVTLVDNDKAGGTGIVLAKDDNGTTGELYIQILSGLAPVDNSVIRRDDISGDPLLDLALVATTVNSKTISPEYLGTSTGSNIIGAYGIGFETADVGSSDRFTALDDSAHIPPNNVVFTVSGVISGEDYVLVGPRLGTALDRGQWLLNTLLSGAAETSVVVKTGTDTVPWPAAEINWPNAGSPNSAIRIQMDDGRYRRIQYTSHDSSGTFTIPSTSFSGDQAAVNNNVFMGFIDLLASGTTMTFTGVHTVANDRDLFVRVRDGGGTPIKTFESNSAQFLATPQTIAAVRTPDA